MSGRPASFRSLAKTKQGAYGKVRIHKESILSQLLHLDEVWAVLMVKAGISGVASGQPLISPNPATEFCERMLVLTSRSFAVVIQQLPPSLRSTVCVFYLVLRVSIQLWGRASPTAPPLHALLGSRHDRGRHECIQRRPRGKAAPPARVPRAASGPCVHPGERTVRRERCCAPDTLLARIRRTASARPLSAPCSRASRTCARRSRRCPGVTGRSSRTCVRVWEPAWPRMRRETCRRARRTWRTTTRTASSP